MGSRSYTWGQIFFLMRFVTGREVVELSSKLRAALMSETRGGFFFLKQGFHCIPVRPYESTRGSGKVYLSSGP